MTLPRVSRRTDPASSVEAEVHVNLTGARKAQMAKVLVAVTMFPNHTAFELSQKINGLDRYQTQRRLSDLESNKKVKKSETSRTCLVTGRLAHTWDAA